MNPLKVPTVEEMGARLRLLNIKSLPEGYELVTTGEIRHGDIMDFGDGEYQWAYGYIGLPANDSDSHSRVYRFSPKPPMNKIEVTVPAVGPNEFKVGQLLYSPESPSEVYVLFHEPSGWRRLNLTTGYTSFPDSDQKQATSGLIPLPVGAEIKITVQ